MFQDLLNKLFPPKLGVRCCNCSKVLFNEKEGVKVFGKLLCKECASWSDEHLNEIQMNEGGYDCGGNFDFDY